MINILLLARSCNGIVTLDPICDLTPNTEFAAEMPLGAPDATGAGALSSELFVFHFEMFFAICTGTVSKIRAG